MDLEGLRLLLKDEFTYYDVSKEKFLEAVDQLFNDYRTEDPPTIQFQVFPGACCNRECDLHLGTTAFRFIGKSGTFTNLRFILVQTDQEKDLVKDIYTCHRLITNEIPPEGDTERLLWVFEEDKITTIFPQDYSIHLSLALKARESWSTKTDQPLTLLEVRTWLANHENLFQDISDHNPDRNGLWKWDRFLRLYSDLEKFLRFLDDLQPHISRYLESNVTQLSESELVSWIVAIEQVLEENYSKVYGWFYKSEKIGDLREITIHVTTRFRSEEPLFAQLEEFLSWFEKDRKKLFDHYFSMTEGEVDQFLEHSKNLYEIYSVITLLSYHLDVRDRFRKQGIFIPYELGKGLDLEPYRMIKN
jgi:hypothetical protein